MSKRKKKNNQGRNSITNARIIYCLITMIIAQLQFSFFALKHFVMYPQVSLSFNDTPYKNDNFTFQRRDSFNTICNRWQRKKIV